MIEPSLMHLSELSHWTSFGVIVIILFALVCWIGLIFFILNCIMFLIYFVSSILFCVFSHSFVVTYKLFNKIPLFLFVSDKCRNHIESYFWVWHRLIMCYIISLFYLFLNNSVVVISMHQSEHDWFELWKNWWLVVKCILN